MHAAEAFMPPAFTERDPVATRANADTDTVSLVRLATEPLVLLAVAHLGILALRLPMFDRLPGWMFTMRAKAIGPTVLLVALAALIAGAAWLATASRQRVVVVVVALIASGYLFQEGLAWSEGRGLNGLRERMVTSGHAEFATLAVQQRSLWSVLTHYEQKVAGGELLRYAHSKPPGQLLFYMATERISRLTSSSDQPDARLAALRTMAALVWPLIAYLALIPLYATVRRLAGDETARITALLYLVVPASALITLHTDSVIFPALCAGVVWMVVVAAARDRVWWAIAAGVLLYVSAFFTFALLAALPLALLSAMTVVGGSAGGRPAVRREAVLISGIALGFGVSFVLFAVAFHYDFFARFSDARNFNAAWKGWDGGISQTLYFALLNSLEYALWVGMPIVWLAAGHVRRAILRVERGDYHGLTLTAIGCAAVLIYLACFGQNKAETARLWLFITPWVCACAAAELQARFGSNRSALAVVVALQWLTVVLTKANQDFW